MTSSPTGGAGPLSANWLGRIVLPGAARQREKCRVLRGLLLTLLAGACSREPSPAPSPSGEGPRPPVTAPVAGQQVKIPEGDLLAGTVPGTHDRHPELEPRPTTVTLGPFVIDRLPYPGDPQSPPRVGATHEEAAVLCAKEGKRLCTELEWERACKGPKNDVFAGGAWEASCTEAASPCASGFDVLRLGALPEWTASAWKHKGTLLKVVRGAKAGEPPSAHRCAHRSLSPEAKPPEGIAFRCCQGAPNAAVIPEPTTRDTFRKLQLKPKELKTLLAEHPRTLALAADAKLFRDPDATDTVIARGPGDKKGFTFGVSPMIWSPTAGAEFLLVTGYSKSEQDKGKPTSFVVAFHVVGDNEYRLAASFLLAGEAGPVTFAYSPYISPRLHFSTCWGCWGETGKILYRHPDSVAILQP